ncbi:TetR/AcrR family transcriptional regulator [Sinanaerobacter chloroacetimidivorans]|uniref:TetR/AcrR family transcriptional regulator n=1 Tax=Sinanaerobacter chloroacetimidivorans TaxID=2818044 RepID=A0A8J8B3I4_9FIRM|nr:TetR/AcrR family transcriptional regulator [Sinanaerobacter chloroacetimidivorans]MBR0600369.1 TetR/AcrR family transcriptional regulator [Sinanaerobacter chloroacetimidivorans]
MPKTFTEKERQYIKQRLMEEAESCLVQYGVKKTTVDELVRRVNIPKGTFYLFYESKELLFFEVFCTFHDHIQKEMLEQLNEIKQNATAKSVTELIFRLYKKVDQSFLYPFLTNGDLELVMRKLPERLIKEHSEKDDFSMERLLEQLPGIKETDVRLFSAALRAVFTTMLHKREIGEDSYEDVLKLMIYGIVFQLFKEESR